MILALRTEHLGPCLLLLRTVTHISHTNRIKCRQTIDGKAVWVVPSSSQKGPRRVQLDGMDSTALLVEHIRFPILQDWDLRNLAGLDVNHKQLREADEEEGEETIQPCHTIITRSLCEPSLWLQIALLSIPFLLVQSLGFALYTTAAHGSIQQFFPG